MDRAAPDSMVARVPAILSYLIHVDSLLAMGVLAIALSVLEWVGSLPGALSPLANVAARLLWCTYFYLVARKAALGKLRLPGPGDYRDLLDTLIKPLVAVGLATSWYWLLLGGVGLVQADFPEFLERFQAHPLVYLRKQGAVGAALLALGLVYLPVALVGALAGAPRMWRHLDPTHGFRMVWRAPRAFSVMFTVLSGLALIGFTLEALSLRLVEVLPIPLAAPVIRHLLRLWVPLAQARLLGGFVFHNRVFLRPEIGDEQ